MDMSKTLRTIGNALEVKRMMSGIRHIEPNDLLHRVGLERRRTAMDALLPALGFFFAGAVVGAGLAVLLTPATGAQVRGKIAKAAIDAKGKVTDMLAASEHEEPETSDEASGRARNGGRTQATPSA